VAPPSGEKGSCHHKLRLDLACRGGGAMSPPPSDDTGSTTGGLLDAVVGRFAALEARLSAKLAQEVADLQELAGELRSQLQACSPSRCPDVGTEYSFPGEVKLIEVASSQQQDDMLCEEVDDEETNKVADSKVVLAGQLQVPPPEDLKVWAQCLRDTKRSIEGGKVVVVGRNRTVVALPSEAIGDVSEKAARLAFEALKSALAAELASSVTPPAADAAADAGVEAVEAPGLLELTRRVVAQLTVDVCMQVVRENGHLKALWQPISAICVHNGQVRVMTLAFVGEPVCGERPDEKRTPFLLRLLTDDLAAPASGSQDPVLTSYLVRAVGASVTSTAAYLESIDPILFAMSTI